MTAQGQHGNSGNLLKDRRGCAPTVVHLTAVSELNLHEKKSHNAAGACADYAVLCLSQTNMLIGRL